MINLRLFKYNSPLAKRMVISVVLASTFITIFTSSFQLYGIYRVNVSAIETRLNDIRVSYSKNIATRLWVSNQKELEATLQGVLRLPDIEYIEVFEGEELIAKEGVLPEKNTIMQDFPLLYTFRGVENKIGHLYITASLASIYSNLYDQALAIIMSNAVKTFFISGFMLFLFYSLIARHLILIGKFAQSINLNSFDNILKLNKKVTNGEEDEIDSLANSLIELQQRLKYSVRDKDRLVESLEYKNEELERFTYTVSHDLKSPLVTISGFIGLLKKDIADKNEKRIASDFAQISDAANVMKDLLDDLLNLSRIGRQMSMHIDVPVKNIVAEILDMLAIKITEHNIKITIDPNLPVINVEEARFKEVFLNLIENAIKYRREGIEAEVSIGVCDDGTDSKNITIYVKDNGIGIQRKYHYKIFELFERLNNDKEGTGVGLAIVKRIIEVHEGRIWVESDGLNKGSTFKFVIPKVA